MAEQRSEAGVITGQPLQHGLAVLYRNAGETRWKQHFFLGTHDECHTEVERMVEDDGVEAMSVPRCMWIHLN